MRFRSITAARFGPHEGRLELAPRMNLIWGPNESGKSSWLAALYAALCGIRRGRGQPRNEDREFEARHRPWDPDARWCVQAAIELDDGTRVEFERDLGQGVDRVVKFGPGGPRSIAGDINHDGAPDGAMLLGLTRDVFRHVAFIRQADLLELSGHADALQATIERAASAAWGDETAAMAIERLEQFHKENVGRDIANTNRPLRRAKDALRNARDALEAARDERRDYERLQVQADDAALDAARAARRLARAKARAAEREAERLERKLARARELHTATPEEPAPITGELEELQRLNGVLTAWTNRPALIPLEGASAAELRTQLEALPDRPTGDLEPHALVTSARDTYDRATVAARAARPRRSRGGAVLAAAGILIVLAAWLDVIGAAWLMPVGIAAALLGAAWWFASDRADRAVGREAEARQRERRRSESELAPQKQRLEEALRTRETLEATAARARAQSEAAERELLETAAALGPVPASPEHAAATIRRRRDELSKRVNAARAAIERWEQLKAILDGLTLAEFAAKVEDARERAATLRADAGPDDTGDEPDALIEDLERRASDARAHAARLRGMADDRASQLEPIARLEEAVATAEAELARVLRLDHTLRNTIEFLERARETTHATIAPALGNAIMRRLERVTAGRYRTVRIDTGTLAVEVRDTTDQPRDATLLSHGTAEQIYLLLRAALAEYMVPAHESCPLLLDEVTAHADFGRTIAMLEVLCEISTDRQIILCTHDRRVRDWACAEFTTDQDRLIPLA